MAKIFLLIIQKTSLPGFFYNLSAMYFIVIFKMRAKIYSLAKNLYFLGRNLKMLFIIIFLTLLSPFKLFYFHLNFYLNFAMKFFSILLPSFPCFRLQYAFEIKNGNMNAILHQLNQYLLEKNHQIIFFPFDS